MNIGDCLPSGIVCHVLVVATDPLVVVGPLVWRPSDGTCPKRWYFIVCTGRADGVHFTSITLDPESPEEDRAAVISAIALSHSARVIHVMGNELDAARLTEAIWPCARTTRLRKAVEAEAR